MGEVMAIFPKSKMATTTRCHSASAYQIWWECAHPRRRNDTLMKSKMAADLWCYFLPINFEPDPSILGKVMAIFQKSKMVAVRHIRIAMTSFNTGWGQVSL